MYQCALHNSCDHGIRATTAAAAHRAVFTRVTILSSGSVFLLTRRATSCASLSATMNTLTTPGISRCTVSAPCSRNRQCAVRRACDEWNASTAACQQDARPGPVSHDKQHPAAAAAVKRSNKTQQHNANTCSTAKHNTQPQFVSKHNKNTCHQQSSLDPCKTQDLLLSRCASQSFSVDMLHAVAHHGVDTMA